MEPLSLHQPSVATPIVGASKVAQIEAAVRACDLQLIPQELQQLAAPYEPHPVLGHK